MKYQAPTFKFHCLNNAQICSLSILAWILWPLFLRGTEYSGVWLARWSSDLLAFSSSPSSGSQMRTQSTDFYRSWSGNGSRKSTRAWSWGRIARRSHKFVAKTVQTPHNSFSWGSWLWLCTCGLLPSLGSTSKGFGSIPCQLLSMAILHRLQPHHAMVYNQIIQI